MTDQSTGRQEKIKQVIATRLETFDYNTLMMGYIFIQELAEATDLEDLSYGEMSDAAKALKSNAYDMYPRHADEFSSQPYLWVTPSPNCKKPATFGEPVDSAHIILTNDRTRVMALEERLLIFSHHGYAAGYIISKGVGDFDIKSHSWDELLESPFEEVILDYVVDATPNVIKLVR